MRVRSRVCQPAGPYSEQICTEPLSPSTETEPCNLQDCGTGLSFERMIRFAILCNSSFVVSSILQSLELIHARVSFLNLSQRLEV